MFFDQSGPFSADAKFTLPKTVDNWKRTNVRSATPRKVFAPPPQHGQDLLVKFICRGERESINSLLPDADGAALFLAIRQGRATRGNGECLKPSGSGQKILQREVCWFRRWGHNLVVIVSQPVHCNISVVFPSEDPGAEACDGDRVCQFCGKKESSQALWGEEC